MTAGHPLGLSSPAQPLQRSSSTTSTAISSSSSSSSSSPSHYVFAVSDYELSSSSSSSSSFSAAEQPSPCHTVKLCLQQQPLVSLSPSSASSEAAETAEAAEAAETAETAGTAETAEAESPSSSAASTSRSESADFWQRVAMLQSWAHPLRPLTQRPALHALSTLLLLLDALMLLLAAIALSSLQPALPQLEASSSRVTALIFLAFLSFVIAKSAVSAALTLLRFCWPALYSPASSSAYHRIRLALRVLSAPCIVGCFLSLAALSLDAVHSESGGLSSVVTLLWLLTSAELFLLLGCLSLYAALHLLFPHPLLSSFPPFIPLHDWTVYYASSARLKPQQGVGEEELQRLPVTVWQREAAEQAATGDSSSCVICMQDMETGQPARVLRCRHAFHRGCIDDWLRRRATCPLCVSAVTA